MNLEEWIWELVGNECQSDGCNVTKWTREPMQYWCDSHNGGICWCPLGGKSHLVEAHNG